MVLHLNNSIDEFQDLMSKEDIEEEYNFEDFNLRILATAYKDAKTIPAG